MITRKLYFNKIGLFCGLMYFITLKIFLWKCVQIAQNCQGGSWDIEQTLF